MSRLLLIFFLGFSTLLYSQEKTKKKKDSIPDGWRSVGLTELLFSQSAFSSDWQGGGTSNVAGNFNLNWDINYKRRKLNWDTKLTAILGLAATKDQKYTRKTTDKLELNSLVGSRIRKTNWYYSGLLNFRTQIAPGYTFFDREILDDTGEIVEVVQDRIEISDSFSPAYLQSGPGILWKKSNDLSINLAPATARFIFVKSKFTCIDKTNPEAVEAYEPYFGVEANESFRFELGASLSLYYKEELLKNMEFENTLNLYADYLEETKNIDLDYTLNLAMQVNRYVTTNLALQLIYDDNGVSGLQVREVLGIGLKYAFIEWKS
ncbi:DUF3078 domain-containing protein [Dokdonia sp. Hel_I_53]|uniref:DUF3078 domain-containing protein n=1 Tax=Dokdonia sp. Hel_I_53 TaxID=1566287 RepID=UPI00119B719B|nr:DUF3078 domain-containing protein [Dokdonia sp. Hel_I_53]TVZ52342.1 Protein of unknown function (DUF3078) [Dokdonia sp. Hel_I_53]